MSLYLIQAFTEKHDLLDITNAGRGDACWAEKPRDAVRIYQRTTHGVLHDWDTDEHAPHRVAYFRIYQYIDRCKRADLPPAVLVTAHGRGTKVDPLVGLPAPEQAAHVSSVAGVSLVLPGDVIIVPPGADTSRRAEYRLRVTSVSHRDGDRFAMLKGVVVKKDGSDRLNGGGTGYLRTAWADLARLIMDTPTGQRSEDVVRAEKPGTGAGASGTPGEDAGEDHRPVGVTDGR